MRPTPRRDRPARSPSTRLATWALQSAASPRLSTPVGHGTVAATPGRPTMSKPKSVLVLAVIVALLAGLASSATPADPIRIAYVDPLSGPFAATGENGLNQFKYATDAINKAGGVLGRQLEIVPLDNKVRPPESPVQLKKVNRDWN